MSLYPHGVLDLLDAHRTRAHDEVSNAENPGVRTAWQLVLDDLDGAAALVRRAVKLEQAIGRGEVEL